MPRYMGIPPGAFVCSGLGSLAPVTSLFLALIGVRVVVTRRYEPSTGWLATLRHRDS